MAEVARYYSHEHTVYIHLIGLTVLLAVQYRTGAVQKDTAVALLEHPTLVLAETDSELGVPHVLGETVVMAGGREVEERGLRGAGILGAKLQ